MSTFGSKSAWSQPAINNTHVTEDEAEPPFEATLLYYLVAALPEENNGLIIQQAITLTFAQKVKCTIKPDLCSTAEPAVGELMHSGIEFILYYATQ